MPVVPQRVEELLLWADAHQSTWTAAGAAIGLTPAQSLAFKTASDTAISDHAALIAAIDALEAARVTSRQSVTDLRRSASDTIRFIKAFAENSTKPDNVYALAQIPPPSAPAPVGPPGTPFDFRAALNPDGSLTIRWKCNNPVGASGTVYTVRRKLAGETGFSIIGAVGNRTFQDTGLPLGQSSVQYRVSAQRGSQVGLASSPFTVQFGTGGDGLTITSQFSGDGGETKLAA